MEKNIFNLFNFFDIFKRKNKNIQTKEPEPINTPEPEPINIRPIMLKKNPLNEKLKTTNKKQNNMKKTTFEIVNGLINVYNSHGELVNQVGTKKQAIVIITALEKNENRDFTKLEDYEIKNTNPEVVKQEDGVFGKGKEWFYYFEGKKSEKIYTSKKEAQDDFLNIE